ncbi:hypothetical protein Q3G72_027308 [Acer saccharum]|nr:hypothetical protein Q3G72_027308 [Acer saccharum]
MSNALPPAAWRPIERRGAKSLSDSFALCRSFERGACFADPQRACRNARCLKRCGRSGFRAGDAAFVPRCDGGQRRQRLQRPAKQWRDWSPRRDACALSHHSPARCALRSRACLEDAVA